MGSYGDFARVYDIFQDNVDYEAWARYIREKLKKYVIFDMKHKGPASDQKQAGPL